MTANVTGVVATPNMNPIGWQWMGPVANAWIVSRVLTASGLLIGAQIRVGRLSGHGFFEWDGKWYLQAAFSGYGPAPAAGHQSPWPFFPLLPGLLGILHALRLPAGPIVIVANHVLLAVALIGVWHLASRRFNTDVANLSVWIVALFPISGVFSMLYPSAIFLAASVWAFEFAERRRWMLCGASACAAAAARPNGVLIAIVLLAVVYRAETGDKRRVALLVVGGPAFCFLIAWSVFCAYETGNPFVFITAKAAWQEQTGIGLLRQLTTTPHFDSLYIHLVLGLTAAAFLTAAWTRLPRSWHILAVITIILPFVSGLVGLGRYVIECFPFAIAGSAVLTHSPRRFRLATGTVAAVATIIISATMAGRGLVP